MQSVYEIILASEREAKKAARDHRKPFFFWPGFDQDDLFEQLRKIPYLGTYLPKGFERVRLTEEFDPNHRGIFEGDNRGFGAYFVDSTGFGGPHEPCLQVQEFLGRIRYDVAYGIVEAGEMQVKVGVFRRKK